LSVEKDLSMIASAREVERTWRERAKSVLDRYRDERKRSEVLKEPRFNVLYANTETMLPLLYSQTPKPDVRRRFRDEDPQAKLASQAIERTLEFFLDDAENELAFKRGTKDLLLPGRAVIRAHYVPTFGQGEAPKTPVFSVKEYADGKEYESYKDTDGNEYLSEEVKTSEEDGSQYVEGEPDEEVVDEKICFERVPWDMFVVEPMRVWEEVTWIAFGSFMDRHELKRTFGRKGSKVQLTHSATTVDQKSSDPNKEAKYALVWELWDKRKREVRCVAESHDDYLRKTKDPLRLYCFFPTPKPLYVVDAGDTLVPVPHFTLYQDQADELDLMTKRICKLVDAMRVRGFYAGAEKDVLRRVFSSDDNEMVPVEDWDGFKDNGLPLEWLPLEQIQKALVGLYQQRQSLLEQIYELIGLSDIMRGSSDPRETKGAQVLKVQSGSRRMAVMTMDTANYFRDLLRIAGELVSEHFSAATLRRITGLEIPDELLQLMKDDSLRSYRIDIETDSTVAPDEQRDKEQAVEAVQAIAQFAEVVFPMVQAGAMSKDVAGEALKWLARKFRMGRDLEDFLNVQQQQPQQPQQDPKAQAEAQAVMQKVQAEIQKMQMELQLKMKEIEAKIQMKQMETQADIAIAQEESKANMENQRIQTMAQSQAALIQAEKQPAKPQGNQRANA
jgi:hypothetical protein